MWDHFWPTLCCWPCENIHVHFGINSFLGTLDFWLTAVWLDNHSIHVDVKFGPSCLCFLAKLIDNLCIFNELVHLCFERFSISSLVHLAIFNPDQSIVLHFFVSRSKWFCQETGFILNYIHHARVSQQERHETIAWQTPANTIYQKPIVLKKVTNVRTRH